MPAFDESNNPPNGTAPESAFSPPGASLGEQITFCRLNMHDPNLGTQCTEWLRAQGMIQ